MNIAIPNVDAAFDIAADNQFAIAESLLRDIPPRPQGRTPDGTPTIEDALVEASDHAKARGLDYEPRTLADMRKVAKWASNGRSGAPISWADTTWKAHVEAYRKGISWDDFATGARAKPVGWAVPEEERREAIRDQAKADGTGPAKAVDIASNTKAMAAAIKADPKTAEAARAALDEHDRTKHDKAVRKAGGNPDFPLDAPGDGIGIELASYAARMLVLIDDAERVLRRAETDEQPRYRAMFDKAAIRLTALAYGKVPDSLEGIER